MSKSSGSLWSHPAGKLLIGVCFWNAVAYGMLYNSFSLFVKPIATTNSFSIGAVSIIVTLMSLAGAAFLNLPGRLMNKVNSRTWFTSIAIGIVLAYVCLAYSKALWQFYASGVFLGIMAAMGIWVTAQLTIPNWFVKSPTYMGIAAGCGGLGAVIGAPIISRFIANGGYSAGFMFEAVIAAIVLIPMGLFVMRFRPEEVGARKYGIEELEAQQAAAASEGQAAAAVAFNGYTEAQARKMPQYWLIWLYVALVPLFSAIFIHVPGALGDKGLDLILVGSVIAVYQFGVMLGQMGLGWFNDKIGVKGASILFTGLGGLACAGMAFYSQQTIWLLSLLVFLLGAARALVTIQLAVVTKQCFGMEAYGKIFSLYYSLGSIITAGYFAGMGFAKDLTGSYAGVFTLILGVAIVCMFLLLTVLNMADKQEERRLAGEKVAA